MKTKKLKKLSLHKETLVNLEEQELRAVNGASAFYFCYLSVGCTQGCPSFTCPTVGCPTYYCNTVGCG